MAAEPDRSLDSATVAECHVAFVAVLERYAWAIVRDSSLASDVVQTSFLALSRFGGDVTPEARKSWLFRVVHREAMRVRERQRPYQTSQDFPSAILEAQSIYEINPLSNLADQEEVEVLTKRISALPLEQREVLRLRFFEDMTFAEIADKMQIPIGTALSRMRLALERLRTLSAPNED